MKSSPLSDFIRNATPEEKAFVYGEVMDRATERQRRATCQHRDIANMDWVAGLDSDDRVPMVNRICTKCYQHWAGPEGAVIEYTRSEWDALIADACSPEKI